MIASSRSGWQTILADLSLILFMISAASIDKEGSPSRRVKSPVETVPVAVFREGARGVSLQVWLAQQAVDPRQRLTINALYAPAEGAAAAAAALRLSDEASVAGFRARILLEPSTRTDVQAVLSFDGHRDWHESCSRPNRAGAKGAQVKDVPCD